MSCDWHLSSLFHLISPLCFSGNKKRKKKSRHKSTSDTEEAEKGPAAAVESTTTTNGESVNTVIDEPDPDIYPVQPVHDDYIPIKKLKPKYVAILQKVQDRISNPQKGDRINECVSIIQKTGCFSIVNGSFTFDLCLLDKLVVKQIVEILDIDYE